MSRVPLASIPALTFYNGALTKSRRTPPIPQLECVGRLCNLFQPDVVRCVNQGGTGPDIDWKCEADLPETLRFGRVEVSCEGWSGAGDSMVLKGSCGLEYRLVRIPSSLQNDGPYIPKTFQGFTLDDILKAVFIAIWTLLLLFILYSLLKSFFSDTRRPAPAQPSSRTTGTGWFPGHHPDDADGPPPYSRYGKSSGSQSAEGWRPGFWTGLGLGGLAANLWGRQRNTYVPPQRTLWDWELPNRWWWGSRTPQPSMMSNGWFRRTESESRTSAYDRGEGSSNLGRMRRSTGWGGTNVR